MLAFLACLVDIAALLWEMQNNSRIYPAPAGEPMSTQFKVSVEGENVPVYLARVVSLSAEKRVTQRGTPDTTDVGFASFDINGKVQITLDCSQEVHSAKLLPTARGITPAIAGHQVTFAVDKPGQFVLDINGDWLNSLHLFVNPFEADAPKPGDPNVIYFGRGGA